MLRRLMLFAYTAALLATMGAWFALLCYAVDATRRAR